jgi:hypothetical protein
MMDDKRKEMLLEKAQNYTKVLMQIFHKALEEESIPEIESDDDLKAFIHAIGNAFPAMVHNIYTEQNATWLEFNHIANHLCCELSTIK